LQVAQHVNGKDDVDVLVCVRVVVVVVRDHELRREGVGRNDAETEVAEFVGDIERLLAPEVHAAGGDERDGGLVQLAVERRKRHTLSRKRRHSSSASGV
jgi:hypothetical protein